ncbi:MAG: DUF202 domain-containing protein [Chitinophagales bacterium]
MEKTKDPEIETDPRVELAVERTALALERTHLAWIRMMFNMITSGLAIDKGLEIIAEQKLLSHKALIGLANSGHIIGIILTTSGTLLLLAETLQFERRSRQLAMKKKEKFPNFTTTLFLSILVMLVGLALICVMLSTN